MKNLRSELQEHRVNALENPRQPDPNQKGRQNATRFCNYCRSNGHTQNWCRRRMRDEEIRRVQYNMSHQRNVAPNGTAELAALTVNHNTVKTRIDLWIGMMETTQPLDFSLLREKLGKMEITNGDSCREPMASTSILHNLHQLMSLMMRCPTRSHWATKESKVFFYHFLLHPFQTSFTLISLDSISLVLTLNLISILRIQDTVTRLRLKNLSTPVVSQITWDL